MNKILWGLKVKIGRIHVEARNFIRGNNSSSCSLKIYMCRVCAIESCFGTLQSVNNYVSFQKCKIKNVIANSVKTPVNTTQLLLQLTKDGALVDYLLSVLRGFHLALLSQQLTHFYVQNSSELKMGKMLGQ